MTEKALIYLTSICFFFTCFHMVQCGQFTSLNVYKSNFETVGSRQEKAVPNNTLWNGARYMHCFSRGYFII